MPVVTSVISGSNDSLILSGGVNEGVHLTGSVFFKNAAKFGGGYGASGVPITSAGAVSADGNVVAGGNITIGGNISGDGDESKTIFAETATSSNTITIGGGGKVVASGDLQITHTGSFGALQVGTDYDGNNVPDAGYPFRVSNDADDVGIVIDAGNNKVASLLFSERSLETAAPGWFVDHNADVKNRSSWRTQGEEQGQGAIVIHNDLKSVRIGGGDIAGDGYDAESLVITSSDYRDPSMIRIRTKHGSRSKEAYPAISWMMEAATSTNTGHWVMGIDPYSDGDGDSAGEYLKINASSPGSSTGMSNTTAMTFRKGGDDAAVGVGGSTNSRSLIPTGTLHVENAKAIAYSMTKDLTSAQLFIGNSYNSTNAASAGIYLDVSSDSDDTKHSAHLIAVSNGVAAEHTAYFSLGLYDGSGNANSTRSRFRVDDQGGALFISGTNPSAGAGWPKPEVSNNEVNVEVPSGSLTLLSNVNFASQPTLNFVAWPANAYAARSVTSGQEMGRISWWSSDTDLSEGERVGAFIEAVADANHTAVAKSPMKLDFYTRGNAAASPDVRLSISSSGRVTIAGDADVGGDLTVEGNDIKDSGGNAAVTFDGSQNTTLGGNLTGSNALLSGDLNLGTGIAFQQASSNLTVEVTNSIVLDSDSGFVHIKDGGASHFKFDCNNTAFTIYDDTFAADYLSFQVAADGASTISTGDNGSGESGHLTLAPDGEIYLETKGAVHGPIDLPLSMSSDKSMILQTDADGDDTGDVSTMHWDFLRYTTLVAQMNGYGDLWLNGDLTIEGNDLRDSGDNAVITFDGSGNVHNNVKFNNGLTVGSTKYLYDDTGGALYFAGSTHLQTAGDFTVGGNLKKGTLTITANEIDASSGDLTLDVAGDIALDAAGDQIAFKDSGVTRLTVDMTESLPVLSGSGDFYIKSSESLIFQIDTDNNGSEKYSFLDGAGTEVFSIAETGTLFVSGNVIQDSGGNNNILFDGDGHTTINTTTTLTATGGGQLTIQGTATTNNNATASSNNTATVLIEPASITAAAHVSRISSLQIDEPNISTGGNSIAEAAALWIDAPPTEAVGKYLTSNASGQQIDNLAAYFSGSIRSNTSWVGENVLAEADNIYKNDSSLPGSYLSTARDTSTAAAADVPTVRNLLATHDGKTTGNYAISIGGASGDNYNWPADVVPRWGLNPSSTTNDGTTAIDVWTGYLPGTLTTGATTSWSASANAHNLHGGSAASSLGDSSSDTTPDHDAAKHTLDPIGGDVVDAHIEVHNGYSSGNNGIRFALGNFINQGTYSATPNANSDNFVFHFTCWTDNASWESSDDFIVYFTKSDGTQLSATNITVLARKVSNSATWENSDATTDTGSATANVEFRPQDTSGCVLASSALGEGFANRAQVKITVQASNMGSLSHVFIANSATGNVEKLHISNVFAFAYDTGANPPYEDVAAKTYLDNDTPGTAGNIATALEFNNAVYTGAEGASWTTLRFLMSTGGAAIDQPDSDGAMSAMSNNEHAVFMVSYDGGTNYSTADWKWRKYTATGAPPAVPSHGLGQDYWIDLANNGVIDGSEMGYEWQWFEIDLPLDSEHDLSSFRGRFGCDATSEDRGFAVHQHSINQYHQQGVKTYRDANSIVHETFSGKQDIEWKARSYANEGTTNTWLKYDATAETVSLGTMAPALSGSHNIYAPAYISVTSGETSSTLTNVQNVWDEANYPGGNITYDQHVQQGITYTASNGRFTVDAAGVYDVTFVGILEAQSTDCSLLLYVNTTAEITATTQVHTSVDPVERTLTGIFHLNANDYIQIYIDDTSGGTVNTGSTISIRKIG